MGKLRLLLTAAAFLLMFTALAPTVKADGGDTYEVGADVLNVRSGPAQDASIIGQLAGGDRIAVFQQQNGWAQTYYDGEEVWVAAPYLVPAENNMAVSGTSSEANENAGKAQPASESSGTLDGYHIVLDPGHGGKDPGAAGSDRMLEKDLTIATADRVAQDLREAGATVTLTRSDDSFVSLENRVRISNENAADAFISLHYNAFPLEGVNGFSAYYDSSGAEKALAADIQSGLEQRMELNSRGIMQNGYHVLSENSDLSVLVELGFMTNPYDLSVIETAEHQRNVAEGIVDGIKRYFNT
ncbi:N-acetylmuramoyl-L-alanine amidase [Lentibacillus salinarum]|uniref:N-acetylmuramoyl-L-alanine amidase n=1 Tax=Lentibacillus salinarum TaxID=446820 RepID=A0ABW3ZSM4_9BACI